VCWDKSQTEASNIGIREVGILESIKADRGHGGTVYRFRIRMHKLEMNWRQTRRSICSATAPYPSRLRPQYTRPPPFLHFCLECVPLSYPTDVALSSW
jgi:hypothetical protein